MNAFNFFSNTKIQPLAVGCQAGDGIGYVIWNSKASGNLTICTFAIVQFPGINVYFVFIATSKKRQLPGVYLLGWTVAMVGQGLVFLLFIPDSKVGLTSNFFCINLKFYIIGLEWNLKWEQEVCCDYSGSLLTDIAKNLGQTQEISTSIYRHKLGDVTNLHMLRWFTLCV